MTISSILGLRGPAPSTALPAASLGHRAPFLHGAQNRGDIWIHSDGWKGGKKGDSAALSALTLLAFLFFLHILQSCLQDMNMNQPTMMMATAGARREEVPTMVAVPMATAMPMPAAPMPPPPARARRHAPTEELARHLQRVQQQHRHTDAPGWEMVSVVHSAKPQKPRVEPAPADTTMVEVELASRHTSTPAPLHVEDAEVDSDEELPDAVQRVVSITPRPVEDSSMVRVSSSSSSAEDDSSLSDAEPVANKQEEYDLGSVPVAVPVAMVPMRPAGAVVTFVPLASRVRGLFSLLAAPLLRMVQPQGLGAALGAGLRQGLRTAMCCDLVVCEAHRLGSIGGRIGQRVATTVSSVMRWACGEAEEGELKTAALRGQGRDGDGGGCREHIEQCERRAGRRTPVSTIASMLEAFVANRA